MADLSKIRKVDLSGIRKVDLQQQMPTQQPVLQQSTQQQQAPVVTDISKSGVKIANIPGKIDLIEAETKAKLGANQEFTDAQSQKLGDLIANAPEGSLVTQELRDAIDVAGGDFDAAVKIVEFKYKLKDDKQKSAFTNMGKLLPEMVTQMNKIPAGVGLQKIPTQAGNWVKGKVGLLPEYNTLDALYNNVATPFARALGDMRVSDADAARATALLRAATFGGSKAERRTNMNSLYQLLNIITGVDWKDYTEKQTKNLVNSPKKAAINSDAYDWAIKNSDDPKAMKILNVLGIK